jgi:AAHS family cis,cis-muconate transporter-like MFS transporter
MPHVPSEDMDMTTNTVTSNNTIQRFKRQKDLDYCIYICFFALLCDGADLGF